MTKVIADHNKYAGEPAIYGAFENFGDETEFDQLLSSTELSATELEQQLFSFFSQRLVDGEDVTKRVRLILAAEHHFKWLSDPEIFETKFSKKRRFARVSDAISDVYGFVNFSHNDFFDDNVRGSAFEFYFFKLYPFVSVYFLLDVVYPEKIGDVFTEAILMFFFTVVGIFLINGAFKLTFFGMFSLSEKFLRESLKENGSLFRLVEKRGVKLGLALTSPKFLSYVVSILFWIAFLCLL